MDITKRMSSWFMKPGVKASTLAVCHCPEGGVGDTHTHTPPVPSKKWLVSGCLRLLLVCL